MSIAQARFQSIGFEVFLHASSQDDIDGGYFISEGLVRLFRFFGFSEKGPNYLVPRALRDGQCMLCELGTLSERFRILNNSDTNPEEFKSFSHSTKSWKTPRWPDTRIGVLYWKKGSFTMPRLLLFAIDAES